MTPGSHMSQRERFSQARRRVPARRVAIGAGLAADCYGNLFLLAAVRIEQRSGRAKPGSCMGSSSMTGWAEFGEAASGANRLDAVPTELT
jgi:hypothetical protein